MFIKIFYKYSIFFFFLFYRIRTWYDLHFICKKIYNSIKKKIIQDVYAPRYTCEKITVLKSSLWIIHIFPFNIFLIATRRDMTCPSCMDHLLYVHLLFHSTLLIVFRHGQISPCLLLYLMSMRLWRSCKLTCYGFYVFNSIMCLFCRKIINLRFISLGDEK